MVFAPAAFARVAIICISTTRINGLLGVSISTNFGDRSSAAASIASLPWSMNATSNCRFAWRALSKRHVPA